MGKVSPLSAVLTQGEKGSPSTILLNFYPSLAVLGSSIEKVILWILFRVTSGFVLFLASQDLHKNAAEMFVNSGHFPLKRKSSAKTVQYSLRIDFS